MSTTEKFDYEAVKSKMNELDALFGQFAAKLKEANDLVNSEVNTGAVSAIYGITGTNVLNTWNQNAATFSDFRDNFDKWSTLVTIVSMNNMNFDAETYRTTGGTMSGVSQLREDAFNNSAYLEQTYSSAAAADANFTSAVNGIEGEVQSLVQPGEAYTMSRGSTISVNGQTYYYYGTTYNGIDLFTTCDPNTTEDVPLYKVHADGDVYQYQTTGTITENTNYKHIYTTTRKVMEDDRYAVTSLNATTDSDDWVVSNEYIDATNNQANVGISTDEQLEDSLGSYSSFSVADGQTIEETDGDNQTFNSTHYYNTSNDVGYNNTTYYVDENQDGFITSNNEVNDVNNGSQHAFSDEIDDIEEGQSVQQIHVVDR